MCTKYYLDSIKIADTHPQVQYLSEELNRLTMLHGAYNLDIFWDIPADKLSLLRKATGEFFTQRWEQPR
ncbi:MAG: hypothetical protein ACK2TW_02550 [Anaerolineales bacterium]|jgi:hypothetical protein